jgi:hypothetical protein
LNLFSEGLTLGCHEHTFETTGYQYWKLLFPALPGSESTISEHNR